MNKLLSVEEIIYALVALDLDCQKKDTVAELMLLGGAAIALSLSEEFKFRETRDIDVNVLAANDMERIYTILEENDIDIVGGVMELPPMEDFKTHEKYELELGFMNIKVYVPRIELLACSKIFSIREKDLLDLRETDLLNSCDKAYLMDLVEDYKLFSLSMGNPDLNIHQLPFIFEEKGI